MPKRSTALLALLLFLGVAAVVVFGNRTFLFETEVHEISDFAVNALQIDRAKHFEELYGNYSRFHFNHPGPAFFYLYGLGERVWHDALHLVPSPYNAHLLTGILVQSAFFVLGLLLLSDAIGSRRLIPLALLIGAIHFALARNVLVSIWPPEVLLMPFFAFFAACVGIACGRWAHLPWAVLSGSFLVHGHVAQPLFVGTLFLVAYVCAAVQSRREKTRWPGAVLRTHVAAHLAALLVLAAFVAPLVIDATRGDESNLNAILRHVRTNIAGDKTVWDSLWYFLGFISYTRRPEVILTTEAAQPLEALFQRPGMLILWGASLVIVLLAALRSRQSNRPALRTLLGFWCLTVLLCVVWGLSQTGPMFAFNGHFYHAVHFLVYLMAGYVLLRRLPRWFFAMLALPAIVAAGVLASNGLRHESSYADPIGLQIRQTAERALATDPEPDAPKLLVFDGEHWSEGASLALALRRHGVAFRAGPSWQFMFQPRYTLRSEEFTQPDFNYSIWRLVANPRVEPALPLPNGVQLVFDPPSLPPIGGRIGFDTNEFYHYYVSGISGPVPGDGAWTDDSDAVIQFKPEPTTEPVHVHIVAYPFLVRDRIPEQPTELWFNEHLVFSGPFIDRGVLRILLPPHLWNEKSVATLRLHLPNAHAPAEMGLWADTRFLALCLQELRTFVDEAAAQ